jgi:molecular chaperone GrpE
MSETENREPRPAANPGTPGGEAEEVAGSSSVAGDGSDVSAELEELVADVRRERDEYLALAQRAKADFENYRKRAQRDAAEAEKRGRAKLATAVLPSVDNLERAMLAAGIDPRRDQAVSEEVSGQEALARGVELVHAELQNTLARAGVEPFDPLGEKFDPTTCEAISTRPADGDAAGTVVETLERGYLLDGQILRPARVIVSE